MQIVNAASEPASATVAVLIVANWSGRFVRRMTLVNCYLRSLRLRYSPAENAWSPRAMIMQVIAADAPKTIGLIPG